MRREAASEVPTVVVTAGPRGRALGEVFSRIERPVWIAQIVEVDDDVAPGSRCDQAKDEPEEGY